MTRDKMDQSKDLVNALFFDKIFNLLLRTQDEKNKIKSFEILCNLIHSSVHRKKLASQNYFKQVYANLRIGEIDDKTLAKRLLEMTELTGLASRNVKGLSGGQKQRVSLCRAMMKKPKLLLMDEPLSALDPVMRTKLQDEILKLHKTFGTTTIMVSHDTDVSYHLADRILVLDHGKIVADGSPKEILVKTTKEVYTLCR